MRHCSDCGWWGEWSETVEASGDEESEACPSCGSEVEDVDIFNLWVELKA